MKQTREPAGFLRVLFLNLLQEKYFENGLARAVNAIRFVPGIQIIFNYFV